MFGRCARVARGKGPSQAKLEPNLITCRLKPFPGADADAGAVAGASVDLTRAGARLELRYRLEGDMGRLRLPAPATAIGRADGLWRATCFEAFVRRADGRDYLEFNLSPSGQWAAYRFDDYRDGMADLDMPAPAIGCEGGQDRVALEAVLDLPAAWADAPLDVALCAVIEDAAGALAYWALTHPVETPDFHHPGGFALHLPASESS